MLSGPKPAVALWKAPSGDEHGNMGATHKWNGRKPTNSMASDAVRLTGAPALLVVLWRETGRHARKGFMA